ncbi:unnamed protein product, partial [Rotaria sordida]
NLLKNKILCFDELDEDFRESDSKMNSKIKLHNEFTSERIRVNLSMGSEPTREKDINETIDNDRELVIQMRINNLNVIKLEAESPVTLDLRPNCVRIFYDEYGNISSESTIT